MDRIDIQVDVPAVPYKDLSGGRAAESSEMIRHRVVAARSTQLRRFFDEHIYSNAQMGPRHIRKYCVLNTECEKIMENAVTKRGFSARGYDRILKRKRTSGCATGVLPYLRVAPFGANFSIETRKRKTVVCLRERRVECWGGA